MRIPNTIQAARQVYCSSGLLVLLVRVLAYIWKQCFWLYIRARNPQQFITRLINGSIMYLNLEDTGISKELAVYKTHEPITTKLLQQEIKPGMHVIDIGANIGYYALLEAKLVGEGGEVIAIEPAADNMALLKRNIDANGYHNIRVHDVAIGPENGTANMYLSGKSNLCSMMPHIDSNGTYVTVKVMTLDSLLENEKRIDYIQMDMEGYEVEAIKGMQEILKHHHPGIFLELHTHSTGSENAANLLRQLAALGYKTKYVVDKAFNYPLIKSKKAVETPAIEALINDQRISQERAVLNIFFV